MDKTSVLKKLSLSASSFFSILRYLSPETGSKFKGIDKDKLLKLIIGDNKDLSYLNTNFGNSWILFLVPQLTFCNEKIIVRIMEILITKSTKNYSTKNDQCITSAFSAF